MNEEIIERLVASLNIIASSLEGLHEEAKRAGQHYWPEPGQQKEAIFSRVPTEEDRIREQQGVGDNIPIDQWITDLGDPEGEAGIIGERSRQWIIDHPPEKTEVSTAGAKTSSVGEQNAQSTEKVEGQT